MKGSSLEKLKKQFEDPLYRDSFAKIKFNFPAKFQSYSISDYEKESETFHEAGYDALYYLLYLLK